MNARGKTIDTTYLSLETAEERGFIHRDYIAHCLRWSHVIKRLSDKRAYETARILDVGCGRELPLPTTLYSSRFIVQQYVGVDAGPINLDARERFHSGRFPVEIYERTDFLDLDLGKYGERVFNVVTCFEVLEHVEPEHMILMLRKIKQSMDPAGRAFISTPCWDVATKAANHVNEMRYEALGAVIEREGFTIKDVHGTFASIREYEPHLKESHREAFNDLRGYYDVNFLACIFAPFYPAYSRNCLWELSIDPTISSGMFKPITEVPEPWGSSDKWKDMSGLREDGSAI